MRLFFSGLLILMIVGLMQSCKEGCKDKSALNYDSKASTENGTCMYCKEAFVADTATYFFAISDSAGGTITGNTIEYILITTNHRVSGNGCKSVGKQVSDKCYNYLSMVNLTNKNAQGFIDVAFIQNGLDAWFFQNQQQFLLGPPGTGTDTVYYGIVDSSTCSNLTSGTMNIFNEQIQFF